MGSYANLREIKPQRSRKYMPFTIGGEWAPRELPSRHQISLPTGKPVKIRLLKRAKNVITVILNLHKSEKEMKEIVSVLKKRLGTGGSVKGLEIEIQGDKVAAVQDYFKEIGIKTY